MSDLSDLDFDLENEHANFREDRAISQTQY